MADKSTDTNAKLNMSLDALIGENTRGDKPPQTRRGRGGQGRRGKGGDGGGGGPGPGGQQWGGGRGNGGRGNGGSRGNGQQQQQLARTNTGLVMPSFGGVPFGGGPFGGGGPFNRPFNAQHFGGMPPDAAMRMGGGLPMPMMPPHFFAAFGPSRGAPPPQQEQPAEPPRPSGPAAVPQARLDEESGEVTVSFKGRQIVKIARSGAITLDTNGVRGPAVFMALNAVLNTVGISITRPKQDDDWSVADGRSLTRFRDGLVLPPKGPQAAQRGHKIVAAFGGADPSAAAAATAASDAAAAAAGIILPGKGGRGGAGGRGRPGSGRGRGGQGPGQQNGAPSGPEGGAGKSPEEADRIRRLRAKGRYTPY